MTDPGGRRPLRLMETFRNLFYTPVYVAVAGGFLYQEGLDVLFSTAPPGRPAIGLLRDGTADILQTGVSRSLMALDQGEEDAPLHIAEINRRDGFFLVSRQPTDGWKWADLEGASMIPVGFTPVPWMSLRSAMKRHGVDIAKVRLIEGLTAQEALDRFRSGDGDYIHMPNPQAEQLVQDGVGYFASAIGSVLEYLCYSSFAVRPEYLETKREVAQRFVRGFHSAQKWLAASDSEAVAAMVAPFFPETDQVVVEQSIQRYREQSTWAEDPLIGEDGYLAMRDVVIEGGLVKGRHPYSRLVRPEFAFSAMKA